MTEYIWAMIAEGGGVKMSHAVVVRVKVGCIHADIRQASAWSCYPKTTPPQKNGGDDHHLVDMSETSSFIFCSVEAMVTTSFISTDVYKKARWHRCFLGGGLFCFCQFLYFKARLLIYTVHTNIMAANREDLKCIIIIITVFYTRTVRLQSHCRVWRAILIFCLVLIHITKTNAAPKVNGMFACSETQSTTSEYFCVIFFSPLTVFCSFLRHWFSRVSVLSNHWNICRLFVWRHRG